jgi:hypothetical protein
MSDIKLPTDLRHADEPEPVSTRRSANYRVVITHDGSPEAQEQADEFGRAMDDEFKALAVFLAEDFPAVRVVEEEQQ